MDYSLVNSKIGAENQLFFLNKDKIVGIQSLEAGQKLGLAPLSYIGIGSKTLNYIPRAEQSNSLSINSYLINSDPFFRYVTGSELVNGYLLREQSDITNNYCFLSGYFNDFQCSYSIGNPAQISTTLISVMDGGKIPTGAMSNDQVNDLKFINTGNFSTGTYLIPSIGTITLGIDLFNTNRLQNFTLRVSPKKTPVYNLGSKTPKRIENFGSDINLDCSFEIGNYELSRLRNFPQSGVIKNLSLQVNDYSTNAPIANYSFNNLNLINESVSVSANENVLVNVSFATKIYVS